jgi:hypothetical protein
MILEDYGLVLFGLTVAGVCFALTIFILSQMED